MLAVLQYSVTPDAPEQRDFAGAQLAYLRQTRHLQNLGNAELIKAGLAEVYRGKPPRGFDLKPCSQAEAEAKKAKRGIWSLVPYI